MTQKKAMNKSVDKGQICQPYPYVVGLIDKGVINKAVFEHRHVIRHDFIGETLSAEDFAEFQRNVNQRRPYCPKDFVPQHFIPDLSDLDKQRGW